MVVLAASICTRGGKALLSRQFKELNQDRIVALLANFPSLISNSGQQHTTVEDENVRFVYQPLEEFYIVLITLKNSNILQDIDTLHLFALTVSNLVRSVDERELFENSFEILLAFDEIINLGFKENLTMLQVQTFLEMDSHEEKIQEIIERNKEMEATEERKRRAKEIHRKELARKTMERYDSASGMGMGMGGAGGAGGYQQQQHQYDNGGYGQSQAPSYSGNSSLENTPSAHSTPRGPVRGGLQLGKKTLPSRSLPESNQPLLTQSKPQFHHGPIPQAPSYARGGETARPVAAAAAAVPATTSAPKINNNGILITISEKVSAEIARDGSITKSEVKGDLKLRINNPDYAKSKILLKKSSTSSQFKARPEVDMKQFNASSVIALKDASKSFPSNDQSLGVLRWRAVGKEDDSNYIPIVITAWVNMNELTGVADVTLEYEITSAYLEQHPNQAEFNDVKILIPIQTHEVNLLNDPEEISYDVTDYGVVFNISTIKLQEEPSGSFEFQIPAHDEDSLFPMELQFDITRTELDDTDSSFGGLQVLDVVNNDEDEESLPFDLHSTLSTDSYQII